MSKRKQITYKFLIRNTNCKNCLEEAKKELADLSYVSNVEIDNDFRIFKITGDFENIPGKAMEQDFNYILAEHGVVLSFI